MQKEFYRPKFSLKTHVRFWYCILLTLTGTDQKERIVLHPGLLPLFSKYRAKQGLGKSEIFTGNRDRFPISMQMH